MQVVISAMEKNEAGMGQREFQAEGEDSNLNQMVREDLTKNKDNGSKEVSRVNISEGRVFQADETASAMALGQKSA